MRISDWSSDVCSSDLGGAVKIHPTARALVAILQVETAGELARIIAAVGLAQNFGAMKALATEGIQRGHMSLHAQNLAFAAGAVGDEVRSEEHTSELQSLMRISYAVFCLKKKKQNTEHDKN